MLLHQGRTPSMQIPAARRHLRPASPSSQRNRCRKSMLSERVLLAHDNISRESKSTVPSCKACDCIDLRACRACQQQVHCDSRRCAHRPATFDSSQGDPKLSKKSRAGCSYYGSTKSRFPCVGLRYTGNSKSWREPAERTHEVGLA